VKQKGKVQRRKKYNCPSVK